MPQRKPKGTATAVIEMMGSKPAKDVSPLQKGLREGRTRVTLILDIQDLETLKDYAYTERLKLSEVVDQMAKEYIQNHVDPDTLEARPGSKREA